MLYKFILNYVDIFSFLNVFKYLTVRTWLAMFTSIAVVFLIGTPFINFFSAKHITNPIREDGPDYHIIKKIGTPTMGGVLILIGLFSSVLMWCNLSNPYIWTLIFVVAGFGLLGAYDDYKKIKFNNPSGVSFKFKIIIQVIIAVLGSLILINFSDHSDLEYL